MRQHGYNKRRTWKKLHLCVDESNSEIISASLTDHCIKDNEVFEEILEGPGVKGVSSERRRGL